MSKRDDSADPMVAEEAVDMADEAADEAATAAVAEEETISEEDTKLILTPFFSLSVLS
jgi:hypothetical protein